MLLGAALRATTRRAPTSEVLVAGTCRWTYAEWNAEVNRLAHALLALGLGVGDRIACSLTNRVELLTTIFAAQKVGAVAVPLNYRLTAAEVGVVAADCAPKAWCFEAQTAPAIAEVAETMDTEPIWIACGTDPPVPSHRYDDLLSRGSADEPGDPPITPDDPSLIMYTSGTTGRPKGVVLSHRAQFVNTVLMLAELGFTEADRTLHIAPLYHVAAYHVVALPHLFAGGANVLVDRYRPDEAATLIETEGITNILGAPTHFELWSLNGRIPSAQARTRLRQTLVTGAPIRPDTVEWIRGSLVPGLWNVYGQTEASSLITVLPPDQIHRMGPVNCIGRPLVGMEVRVAPADTPVASAGTDPEPEIGELICRGPKLMTCYYKAPEKTSAKIQAGWLRTGDLVRCDADGYYHLLGRVDDLIITGGENVYPQEVEQALLGHPDVADCAVVGVPDPTWGQVIAAFVVPAGPVCDLGTLARHADRRLARYKRPRRWTLIDAIPRSPSGKILVRELRARIGELKELS